MKIKTIGAVILAGAVIAGCGKKEAEDQKTKAADEMAVSVNGEKLMKSAIDADVEAMVKAQGSKIPAEQMEYARQMMANQVVQSFIVEKVLVGKAKAEGYTVTDADRKAREEEFLKAVAKMPNAPKTVEEYFKKFPLGEARARAEFENDILIDKMIKAEQAKAPTKDYKVEAKKMIDNVISNNLKAASSEKEGLEKIKKFQAELAKPGIDIPKKFAELAKANSDCPSKAKGGDLGEFTHGQMVKEFDEVAFKLPVGKVSEPVKTQFGYHLILVTKKVPAVEAKGDQPASPEKVQASHILVKSQATQEVPKMDDVIKYLKKQGERSFLQDFVKNQMKAAKIQASEEFKQFLPEDNKPAEKAKTPVEKSTAK